MTDSAEDRAEYYLTLNKDDLNGIDAQNLARIVIREANQPNLSLSMALLVADALDFTPGLTERQREILVGALREAAVGGTTLESEREWFQQMLDAKMETIAPYKEDA
jgi:hypothetical protein